MKQNYLTLSLTMMLLCLTLAVAPTIIRADEPTPATWEYGKVEVTYDVTTIGSDGIVTF